MEIIFKMTMDDYLELLRLKNNDISITRKAKIQYKISIAIIIVITTFFLLELVAPFYIPVLVMATILLIIWFFSSLDYEQDEGPIVACKKYLKKSVIWLCVSGLLFTVIPSKDTMYTMIVLDNVTTDNIQAIGKTGKDIIDYITDQINKIVNDKEEDKK